MRVASAGKGRVRVLEDDLGRKGTSRCSDIDGDGEIKEADFLEIMTATGMLDE